MNPKNEDGDHGDKDDSGIAENVRTVGGSTVAGERDIPSVNRERSLQSVSYTHLDVYKRQA